MSDDYDFMSVFGYNFSTDVVIPDRMIDRILSLLFDIMFIK